MRALLVGAIATIAVLTSLDSVQAATPGTWGASDAAYLDGTVCTSGTTTSPLAAWDFGDTPPEFLLTSVSSDGFHDSASLPESGTPGRVVTPVSPAEYGFDSVAQISTYATLVNRYGSDQGALVAEAILDTSDPANAPTCAGSTQSLVASAAALAGPYVLSLSGPSGVAPGSANSVSVRVVNSTGAAVPGVSVTFTSSEPVLGSAATSAVATTNSAGTAKVSVTAPAHTTISTLDIQASAQASVGLEAVTVDPSIGGLTTYASAVYADPPTTYSACR